MASGYAASLIEELDGRTWQEDGIGLFKTGGKDGRWYIRLRRGDLTVERTMNPTEWPLLRMNAKDYATMVVDDLLRRAENA